MIIWKHIFKNIIDNKLRSILILIVLIITTATFLINFGLKDSLIDMYTKEYSSFTGDTDIIISSNNPINDEDIKSSDINKRFEVSTFNTNGIVEVNQKVKSILLIGTDLSEFKSLDNIVIADGEKSNLKDDEVIISQKTADALDVELGDEIKITLANEDKILKVASIAASAGVYLNEFDNYVFIVTKETVNKYYNFENKINTVYLGVDSKSINDEIRYLKDNNKDLQIREAVNSADINEMVSPISGGLTVALVIVLLMSIYIITSVFNVILIERMSVMGTFRSIGATKLQTTAIIVSEGALNGVVGGALGVAAGCFGIRVITDKLNNLKEFGVETVVDYKLSNILFAFIFAVVVSIISVLISVLKANKNSTKDIILNTAQTAYKLSRKRVIFGFLMLILAVVVNSQNKYNLLLSILVIVLVVVGIILVTPFIVGIFSRLLEKVLAIFSGEVQLANKNLRNNKLVISSVILSSLMIGLIIMIFSISSSLNSYITGIQGRAGYDIFINNLPKQYEEVLDKVKETDGVTDAYNDFLNTINIEYNGQVINAVGVRPLNSENGFFKFFNKEFTFDDEDSKVEDELSGKKNIFLDKYLAYMNNIELNDTVTLISRDDSFDDVEYNVAGFFDSTVASNKKVALVSFDNFKESFSIYNPYQMLIKADKDVKDVRNTIASNLNDNSIKVTTVEDIVNYQKENTFDRIFKIINMFVIFAVVMGFFGMVNNSIISFIKRRKEIAILYSTCMSKFQLSKMIIVESIISFTVASIIGGALGISLIKLLPNLLGSIGLIITVECSSYKICTLLIGNVILLSLISIFPTLRLQKIKVVEELKYE